MKLQNPFVTAGYESPEYFCDREQETAKDVTSVAFVAKHGLHAPSSVSLSLSRLLDGEMLYEQDDGYVVYDRLFGMWLAGVRG